MVEKAVSASISLNLQEFAVGFAVNLINLLSNRYFVALQMEIEHFTCFVWFSLIANSVECASQMRERTKNGKLNSLIFSIFCILNTRVKIKRQREQVKKGGLGNPFKVFSVGLCYTFFLVETNNPITRWLQYATMSRTATA